MSTHGIGTYMAFLLLSKDYCSSGKISVLLSFVSVAQRLRQLSGQQLSSLLCVCEREWGTDRLSVHPVYLHSLAALAGSEMPWGRLCMYVCLNRDPPANKGGSSCRTVPCVGGGWPEPDLISVSLLVFAALCVTKLCLCCVDFPIRRLSCLFSWGLDR